MAKCDFAHPNGRLCRNPAEFEVYKLNACIEHVDKLEDDSEAYYRSVGALEFRIQKHKQSLAPILGFTQIRADRSIRADVS